MDETQVVPGTGMTVGDLQQMGYSTGDIQGLLNNPLGAPVPTDTSTSGGSGTGASGSSSWLSGISGIGTAITNIFRAINPPRAGTPLYNPATGLPYGVNPATGLPYPQRQTQTMGTLLVFAVIAYVLIKTVK